MQNRTVAIIITAVTAVICGCASLFSCIWGFMIVGGTPITTTVNGEATQQTVSPVVGFVLLCLTLLMILVPVAVGFFTLRKKPDAAVMQNFNEPMPPAS